MLFYDIEHDKTLTEKELFYSFMELKKENAIESDTFTQYVKECTSKNGTLEIVKE